jgi:hypothetical protein
MSNLYTNNFGINKKEKIMRYLFILSLCFITFSASATSDQYNVRTEVSFCKYKPGKGYDDVVKHAKKYEKFLRANELKYSKTIFKPVLAGKTDHDYVLWGTWPNGEEMYKEYGAYLNDYDARDINPGICDRNVAFFNTAALHMRIPSEERDRVQMVDFRSCKFTKDASWTKILKLAADNEEANIQLGRDGFGTHYLRPYRGFDADTPFDMISMTHYYHRDKRAEATKTYPAIRDYRRANGFVDRWKENIESCSPSDLYSMEWIYNTSN